MAEGDSLDGLARWNADATCEARPTSLNTHANLRISPGAAISSSRAASATVFG